MVPREDQEKSNMQLNMHEYGCHCYIPTDKAVVLINIVSKKNNNNPRDKLTVQSKQKLYMPKLGIHELNVSGELFKAKNHIRFCDGPRC